MSRPKNNHNYTIEPIKDIREIIRRSVRLFGDTVVFYEKPAGSKSFIPKTFNEFYNEINQLGTYFSNKNLPQNRIAVMGENSTAWCVAYMATVCGSGVTVPIDKDVTADDAINILNVSESDVFVFSGKLREMVLKNKGNLENKDILLIDMDASEESDGILSYSQCIAQGDSLLKNGDNSFLNVEIDPEKMSNLLFTSGTTGMAKGVMLCQRSICSDIRSTLITVRIMETDTLLSVLPLHHTYENSLGFLAAVYCGCTIVFSEGLKHISKNIMEMKPTVIVTVPLLLENIHKKIIKSAKDKKGGMFQLRFGKFLSRTLRLVGIDARKKIFKSLHDKVGGNLRLLISGAAAMDPTVSRDFEKFGLKVLQGYGLTECSPLAIANHDRQSKHDAIGIPIPECEAKINDPDSNGVGEIIVKGPNVMMGYYNDKERTDAVLKDGWFYTGDLGYIGKDGFFRMTGRIKNVIVTKNGKNIYPEELEYFLNLSPYVEECVVWGEDDKNETLVKAQIFPNFDAIKAFLHINTKPSDEEVDKVLNQAVKDANAKLPLYKRIKGFSIRETEFIKTTTKKIKRYLVTDKSKDNDSDKNNGKVKKNKA